MELWCFSSLCNFKLCLWAGTVATLSSELLKSKQKRGTQCVFMLKFYICPFLLLSEHIFIPVEHTKSFNVWNGWKNETAFQRNMGVREQKGDVTDCSLLLSKATHHMIFFTDIMVYWNETLWYQVGPKLCPVCLSGFSWHLWFAGHTAIRPLRSEK